MKLSEIVFFLLTLITSIHALALPASFDALSEASKDLFKRKGGGGRGGGGGGSRGGSSSSSSSSSGSRGGSTSSSSSSSSSRGSGVTPSFGGTSSRGSGGAFYGGGSRTPYNSGARSAGGIAPYALGAGALAFFPGIWLYGAYAYNWPREYMYHNDSSNMNETRPVSCYCARYQQCGCDANDDSAYLNQVANNATVSTLSTVNGTQTLLINGTLPNGTIAEADTSAAAGSLVQRLAETSGYWLVVAGVGYTMWFM